MKLLVLQHVPFEGPAAIKAWADGHGHSIIHHCCTGNDPYPDPASFDCCIILGGPMGVNDQLPWMPAEIEFIQSCIDANKFMLGICLGAQLIASALGAVIEEHSCSEIGWFDVRRVPGADTTGQWYDKVLPETFTPLHWHGDTFAIPPGARHLYQSQACANQMFIARQHLIGLQFHLEFEPATAERVAEASAADLAQACATVQTAQQIVSDPQRFASANQLMHRLLDAMRLEFMRHNL
ncbi:MAG: type 1 glutamine amidotransferase [Pseudomonadales bacterium]|nr:type 1 glutamine amidotransferase [Pseudomonadales bacterium]